MLGRTSPKPSLPGHQTKAKYPYLLGEGAVLGELKDGGGGGMEVMLPIPSGGWCMDASSASRSHEEWSL